MNPPGIITFGELMLRLSPPASARLLESEQFHATFGGAEANVAVALAHLGARATYVTRLPDNAIGDAALEALRREGLACEEVLRGPERMGIYFIEPGADIGANRVIYDRAGSAFSHVTPAMIDWRRILSGAKWLHATGITPLLGAGPAAALGQAIDTARSTGVPFSFDLNFRPALWRDECRPLIQSLVQGVELLIGNPHSVGPMLGLEGGDDLAVRLADQFGARRVALTRREVLGATQQRWSASLHDSSTGVTHTSEPWHVGVVDRVGGGDAFAGALIFQVLQDASDRDALDFAVAASALKLKVPGDFNRVTVAEVKESLRGMRVASETSTAVRARMRDGSS